MPGEAFDRPRATGGRAPDVTVPNGWVRMREYSKDEEVDFVIVGTGAGGGTLAARLAEQGFSVVALDAGPYFRPLDEFASDETDQEKVYWTDRRICDGENPLRMGGNNSGKSVGGSTVHFAMVSLRFRPEWFKSRSQLGYAVDWPLDWQDMWNYYTQTERALSISGPVNYPWGPKRPRYPYRAHEVNAAGRLLAKGAEALGYAWAPTPLATVSAPHGKSPPCVYRGFCRFGCSTNAKQSALIVWIPRAIAAGAEIRDLSMAGRILMDGERATGVEYHRDGKWHVQRARNVVVAGYAIETPRLLLNSATDRFPDGLANRSGLLGKNLMSQGNQGVWGKMKEEVRWYKGPPSLAITEHWNYQDKGKDFDGGYCWMGQGPLPIEWASVQAGSRGIWGETLREEMTHYNHQIGVKMVGEMLPDERNQVTLADETDQYGLRIPRITFSWGENDKKLIQHALGEMTRSLEAIGATEIFQQDEDTNHLAGTARMGFNAETSVVNADCRSWDIRNLWICDGSVFPTTGGVNPSLTIQAIAMRTADRIKALAQRGEL